MNRVKHMFYPLEGFRCQAETSTSDMALFDDLARLSEAATMLAFVPQLQAIQRPSPKFRRARQTGT